MNPRAQAKYDSREPPDRARCSRCEQVCAVEDLDYNGWCPGCQPGIDKEEGTMKIENRETLLQEIADGLARMGRFKLDDLEVTFYVGKERFTFGVAQALDVLVNDLHFDERGDWSRATLAVVSVL